MDKEIIKFDDTGIEEYKFHQYKSPVSINDIDVNKIVASNKLPFGKQDFKYFICYKDAKKIRPLCIFRPKISIYKRDFDETKCMYFFIKDEKTFDKYNKVWEKVGNIIQNKSNSELIYNKKYLNAEKKSTQKKAFNVLVHE